MGGAESVVRNTDKRTSRREHRGSFQEAIDRFRAAPFDAPAPAGAASPSTGQRCVRVCVRKRPFFPHEDQQGEFDVVSCLPRRVVIHDARMRPDMRHMVMNHHDFAFDEVFGEEVDNAAVYAATASEIVASAVEGVSGTVMCYGQTGSGKTFTMSSIYEHVSNDLFASVGSREVTVCFIELLGDKCYDMLNGGTQCNLATAADGSVHPYPCVEVPVTSAADLRAMIDMAGKLRATAATGVHDQSSRSHACCRIFIDCSDGADSGREGTITLVDLAGTEHRIDSAEHNVERQRECAKINASLAALKECIRATAAGAKFVPFRRNWLTQLLRGCFNGVEAHRTVIVSTVSPSSKDTEHSLNTLRHACIMDGQGASSGAQSAHVSGGAVTQESLGEINVTKIARERTVRRKSGTEKAADQWTKPPPAHQAKQSNTVRRSALDRHCLQKLRPKLAKQVMLARSSVGSERQRARFHQAPSGKAADADGPAEQEPCAWALDDWKVPREDARPEDRESLSPRFCRDPGLLERRAAAERGSPAEASPTGDAQKDADEGLPGVAKVAWHSPDLMNAIRSPSHSRDAPVPSLALVLDPSGEQATVARGASPRREPDREVSPELSSSGSSSPREPSSEVAVARTPPASTAAGLQGRTKSAPWLFCAAVAQDALQGLKDARRSRDAPSQAASSTKKPESRLREARASPRVSASPTAASGAVDAQQKSRTPPMSEVAIQPYGAKQEDAGGSVQVAPLEEPSPQQRRAHAKAVAGARDAASRSLKAPSRVSKVTPRLQTKTTTTTTTTRVPRRSRDATTAAKDAEEQCPRSSITGAEGRFGLSIDDSAPPWPPDCADGEERPPPVVRSPISSDKTPRVVRSPRQSEATACPLLPPAAVEGEAGEDGEQEKAMALFGLFCSKGRNAREWRKNDLRLISTCVLPKLFGERTKIDWAHPSAGLDELQRLVAERPLPADLCPQPSAASQQAAQPPPPAQERRRRSASGSGRGSPMARSPSQLQEPRSPAEHLGREGGGRVSRPSVGDARPCARDVSPCPLSPVARQTSQASLTSESSPPPRRAKSSSLLPSRTPRAAEEAAAEPAPVRHRSFRTSREEEIADLEWKVNNTELGVKQWLTELRAAVRQDTCAVPT